MAEEAVYYMGERPSVIFDDECSECGSCHHQEKCTNDFCVVNAPTEYSELYQEMGAPD
jgi:7-cyano-7-deazaguanine synthase in queuosine biosynthesis